MARDGFLSRWSQKKLSEQSSEPAEPLRDAEPVADGSGVIPDQAPASVLAADIEPDEAELTDEELAALPKIEDFTAQTDLTQFMRRGVPKALKLAAMRRMWTVNPTISTYLDVARDYAYDWNTPGGVPGHGGALDAREVARTIDRFLRRPVDAPAEEDAPPTEAAETAPVESPEVLMASSPAPGAPEDDAAASDETFVEDAAAEQKSEAPNPAPRRHGGAVPR